MWNVALVGNPNSGKTTLFNTLTGANAYVGNWPGVTVERKEGKIRHRSDLNLVDLPGIYSLSPYSPEEVVSRNYLMNDHPDAVINIVDSSNLERNLYLTTQLLEVGVPTVLACNMTDIVEKRGDKLDPQALGEALGIPVVQISALQDKGLKELVETTAQAIQKKQVPHFDLPFDEQTRDLRDLLNAFWATGDPVLKERATKEDASARVSEARYAYLAKMVPTVFYPEHTERQTLTDRLDRFVTHPLLGLPIFVVLMVIMYWLAVSPDGIGTRGTDFVNDVVVAEWIQGGASTLLTNLGVSDWLISLVVDGMIGGVGAVIGFLPQMIVLFFLLGILELSGYMARVALILDRTFHHFGLSGKSFIPLLIGTGCSVPGILSSRTIENINERRMTVIINSFMPCGAKLPIIAFFAGAFFPQYWWFAPMFYFIGIVIVAFSGLVLKKFRRFGGEALPFFMELPDYHMPTLRSILRITWERVRGFVVKAGTIILLSSIVMWILLNTGVENGHVGLVDVIDNSFMARIGSALSVIFAPLGFGNWQSVTATIGGLVAKENLMSTFGVIFSVEGDILEVIEEGGSAGLTNITSLYAPLSAISFLLFNLYTIPCFAAVGAMKQELNDRSWFLFGLGYLLAISYSLSLVFYQFGRVILGGAPTIWTLVAAVVFAAWMYLLFRKNATSAHGLKKEVVA